MNDSTNVYFETHFLRLVAPEASREVRQVLRRLVRDSQRQHSCLELSDRELSLLADQQMIGPPEDVRPFTLSANRLYLSRYYRLEAEVAERIIHLNSALPLPELNWLTAQLDSHFGPATDNRQRLAALLTLTRQLCIITGGPGTGKTSTVAHIMAILLEQNPDLVIRLAAPTGKAAMKLAEALNITTGTMDQNVEVSTIHRLLGMYGNGRGFRHGRHNPVSADLLIVDEASMVDLAMMHRLLGAVSPHTRLILLGDPYQLPSVDTGNVLADLCTDDPVFTSDFSGQFDGICDFELPVSSAHGLRNAVCHLTRSYRFDEASGLGQFAKKVKTGSAELRSSEDGSVRVLPAIEPLDGGETLLAGWHNYLGLLAEGSNNPEHLLTSFAAQRILCSHRNGFPGVEQINLAIESALEARGLKQPGADFYRGRPVMVSRNDYHLGLYNGDIGICIDGQDGEPLIYFAGDSETRTYLASQIPTHETCFAMTVHKSQGSEFDRVILLLQGEQADDDELTSRELVYTAITRARQQIQIYGSETAWINAMATSARRTSGMTGFLRDDKSARLAS